jgi:hypothetical protein
MQDAWSTFFDQLKEDLARELQILEGKRSGSWQLRSREPGGNWRDMTQAEIERSEHTIKMLEGVIAKIEREHLT